jgi:putative flippase GtrA
MPLQTFRYAACGGFNTVFGIVLYFVAFEYIFTNETVHITERFVLSRHIAADFLFAFWISFPIGFYLSRYVVFQESKLPRRVQLFRYFVVVCGAIGLNYFFLNYLLKHLVLMALMLKFLLHFLLLYLVMYLKETILLKLKR